MENCPDKEATVEFSLKSTLVSSNVGDGETMSMMSDVMSMDSGPESEYDFGDFDDTKSKSTTFSFSHFLVSLRQAVFLSHQIEAANRNV